MDWTQIAADALAFLLGGLGAALAGVLTQLGIQRSHDRSLSALDFPDGVFDAIAIAYRHGAQMERWVDILEGRTVKNSWIWWWNWPEDQSRKWLIERAKKSAQKSYDAFAQAQRLLGGTDN